jgi:hypothetical protein
MLGRLRAGEPLSYPGAAQAVLLPGHAYPERLGRSERLGRPMSEGLHFALACNQTTGKRP